MLSKYTYAFDKASNELDITLSICVEFYEEDEKERVKEKLINRLIDKYENVQKSYDELMVFVVTSYYYVDVNKVLIDEIGVLWERINIEAVRYSKSVIFSNLEEDLINLQAIQSLIQQVKGNLMKEQQKILREGMKYKVRKWKMFLKSRYCKK